MALISFASSMFGAAAGPVRRRFDRVESRRLVPMLQEVLRFETVQGNEEGHRRQKEWLRATAARLGFVHRDAGKVTEIELPSHRGAPVLGLVVHGDVQPAEAKAWSFPPFAGRADGEFVYGRGAADDKGPLVQALLAMKALEASGVRRTHTIRLLVGSEEESSAGEMGEYLKDHAAPDYSLVLDSEFPVVVGEKAWNALYVTTAIDEREWSKPYTVVDLEAGLAASIVPDAATIVLRWREGTADWKPLLDALAAFEPPTGTTIAATADGNTLRIAAKGRSAHSGVNLGGGRNALIALARAMEGHLDAGGADDLLHFARTAGQDLHGTGLGITDHDPVWGRYAVNVATIRPAEGDRSKRTLTINLRRIPPRTGPELKEHLDRFVARFNARTGSALVSGGWYDDEPLGFDPKGKLVRRLLAACERVTGEKARPAISGGGTYAKRLPNAIAFGMWFPGKPYPGHDVDEKIPIAGLHRGAHVLIEALVDIATGETIVDPFK